MPTLDENLHHLSIRELSLVEQAAYPALVVRRLSVARRVLCQTEGKYQQPFLQGAQSYQLSLKWNHFEYHQSPLVLCK